MQEQSTLLAKIAESADENGVSILFGVNQFDFVGQNRRKPVTKDQRIELKDGKKVWLSDGAAELFKRYKIS